MSSPQAPSPVPRKRVGLLFVHGIGEQKQFEFLTNSVLEFAELMRQSDDNAAVSIVDRTKDWKIPAGAPDKTSPAPVSLSVTSDGCNTDFECHEVWWADLGSRSGIGDVILFWIWGLGQWCAPIYRELDVTQLRKDDITNYNRPGPKIAKIPASAAGDPALEPFVRLELVLAAIAAITVGCTWGLAKRLLKNLLDQAPSPTILVQYVGDVRTYEERGAPGDTALSDPGFPRRVGIRRRMITEMVAMADRGLDEWYVIAHSLGTVLAYNGLTEIGHTLPNYLPQQQWDALSFKYKYDPGCMLRKDIDAMMPARPAWLNPGDVIDRPLLFEKLKGFLTYGSPLNKFVALWPRVVASATDRTDGCNPFAEGFRWINLAAPSDPVAGLLNGFPNGKGELFHNAVPSVENFNTPWTFEYGLAHILYFTGFERFVLNRKPPDRAAEQKRETMKWLMGLGPVQFLDCQASALMKFLRGRIAYYFLVLILLIGAAIVITFAGGLTAALFGASTLKHFASVRAAFSACYTVFWPMAAAFLWAILLAGQWRWVRESSLNARLAEADSPKYRKVPGNAWSKLVAMLRNQRAASALTMAGALVAGFEVTAFQWHKNISLQLIVLALFGLVFSIMLQMWINRQVPPLKKN